MPKKHDQQPSIAKSDSDQEALHEKGDDQNREEVNGETVVTWLAKLPGLDQLIPIFEREQLIDWSSLPKLSISILQSLSIPLGVIFKLENALKETLGPEFRFALNLDDIMGSAPESAVKRVASSLFEWIRESQKNIDRQRVKQHQRPPWHGLSDRQRSNIALSPSANVAVGSDPNHRSQQTSPIHSGSNNHSVLKSPTSKLKNPKQPPQQSRASPGHRDSKQDLATPLPRLRSITGIVSFPESDLVRKAAAVAKQNKKIIVPPPRISSAKYPSIDDEILRYSQLQQQQQLLQTSSSSNNFALAAETKEEFDVAEEIVSIGEIISSSSPSVRQASHQQELSTISKPKNEVVNGGGNPVLNIEARESTPKEMITMKLPTSGGGSKKGHPKTIDPFSSKKFKKSPYIL